MPCARLEPFLGGVECTEVGVEGVAQDIRSVSLPFRVTSPCQECPSPARTDHVLDAPTLFLTLQGGSLAWLSGMTVERAAPSAPFPSPQCRTVPTSSCGDLCAL